ncbi:non-ribosomal peptide synthetase [Streptomyces cyaneofuscatus]|uniref:non-ribosomal peptide synthetase n=1 Tax=Streptomyces cyaneofuscatus TaxID=66883 RepID=UPI0033A0A360
MTAPSTTHTPDAKEGEVFDHRRTVVDRIDQTVRRHPDAAALRNARHELTYREFGALTDDFARLVAERTRPGEFVGIRSHRDIGAIVAIVGALKARRPFVVVDGRDSPASNSAKAGLLGLRSVADTTSPDGRVTLDDVPAEWLPAEHPDRPDRAALPDGIGYAIHTSGSTGRPKCVLVRADPLAHVVSDHVDRLEVGPGARTLQFARLTFDGCLTEILWTLTAGACLVVLEEARLTPGTILAETLEEFGITHLKTTPFALTVTEPTPGMRLRHVINGGGPCRPSVIRTWSTAAAFHNAYGLTETTVCNLLSDPLDAEAERQAVPLGTIVGDCDYHLRPVAGEEASADRGELVITGESVALGYLAEDGLTPFGEPGGEAAYATGDIVEVRDGALHFVERVDRQVKVRGYRLDPGEIENAVCRQDGVLDAVVAAEAHDGARGGGADVLVCYYRGDGDPRLLRKNLEGVLDPYKIPSVFEHVDVFPHTPNGKIDRDALGAGRREQLARQEAPETAGADERILHLVRNLTGVEDIALEDNFFDVGGDSATAVVLVTQMRGLGWVDAGVRDVLRADSLRVLADQLQERGV